MHILHNFYMDRVSEINICESAQRKGPSVGIFISKKIRFYRAVQNFLKKNFLCEFACKYSLLCIH